MGKSFSLSDRGRRRPERLGKFAAAAALVLLLLGAAGCRRDMQDQPKYIPLRESDFFADNRSARPPVENAVARGHLRDNELLYRGTEGGQPATSFPFPVDAQLLNRGRERYEVFCSPCHDKAGYGNGIIIQRGFRRPASYHIDRLRQAPNGHFYDVITNGFGAMYSYASRVKPEDRWAIIAYIRALQLSQDARIEDVPESERDQLQRNQR